MFFQRRKCWTCKSKVYVTHSYQTTKRPATFNTFNIIRCSFIFLFLWLFAFGHCEALTTRTDWSFSWFKVFLENHFQCYTLLRCSYQLAKNWNYDRIKSKICLVLANIDCFFTKYRSIVFNYGFKTQGFNIIRKFIYTFYEMRIYFDRTWEGLKDRIRTEIKKGWKITKSRELYVISIPNRATKLIEKGYFLALFSTSVLDLISWERNASTDPMQKI